MEIRNRNVLDEAMKKHTASRKPLREWLTKAELAEWSNITDARKVFSHADFLPGHGLTCFNIGGNRFRLLTVISYAMQVVSIHEFLTHAQYNETYVWRRK